MIKFSAYKELQTSDGKIPLDVSFEIQHGEIVALYGNSGSGKTTLLRLIAGLTEAKKLYTEVEGELWDDSQKKFHLPVQKRSIGFVFQDFALFTNFSLRENIEYALTGKNDKKLVDELIESLGLESLQHSRPSQLSGGQKQRVALARAVARKPKVLLLDEPLSALDDDIRNKLQEYILRIHKAFGLTTILVSHDLPEICKLSDRVFCLQKGKIVKSGMPNEVFALRLFQNKCRVEGEIISVQEIDLGFVVSISSGQNIVKVIVSRDEVKELKLEQKLFGSSVALNSVVH